MTTTIEILHPFSFCRAYLSIGHINHFGTTLVGMWLINTLKLSLELFYGDGIPSYAILSHTWGDSEVSFQEFSQASETKTDKIMSKAGYHKIVAACHQALNDGYSYAWVDTCCIDKTSSAELTEAINSMFGWYNQSQVCYAYLSDFMLDTADISSPQNQFDDDFRQCRWFNRGWCLQELLAPRKLRFFNHKWQEIGTKSSRSRLISEITGIPEAVLLVPPKKKIQEFPIAARISWITKRQTTRVEDMSYGLLGILDVNMPMLYGEGKKAFLRLQEEIIKKYNDLSIFAWDGAEAASEFMPILASTPLNFVIKPIGNYGGDVNRHLGEKLSTQFSLTNQGVFFPNARLRYQNAVPGYRHHYLLSLNYHDAAFRGRRGKLRYILLQKVGPGLFVRLYDSPDRLRAFQKQLYTSAFSEPVCILNNLQNTMIQQLVLWERYAVRLRWKPWDKLGQKYLHIRTAQPREGWDLAANQFLLEMAYNHHMHIEFVPGNYESNPNFEYFVLVVKVGNGHERDPAKVSVRIVSADVWQRLNVTMMGFYGREALALKMLPAIKGMDNSDHISITGYDISLSVRLVTEPNEQPYHLIYLDWDLAMPSVVTD